MQQSQEPKISIIIIYFSNDHIILTSFFLSYNTVTYIIRTTTCENFVLKHTF